MIYKRPRHVYHHYIGQPGCDLFVQRFYVASILAPLNIHESDRISTIVCFEKDIYLLHRKEIFILSLKNFTIAQREDKAVQEMRLPRFLEI